MKKNFTGESHLLINKYLCMFIVWVVVEALPPRQKCERMGYQQVFELTGGINAWKAANKSIEGISSKKQMSLDELATAINSARIVLGRCWSKNGAHPVKKMEPVLKNLQNNYPINLLS
jgi:hypothetical protein